MIEALYAEDFRLGRTFPLGSRALSAEEIKAFAREWDPMPFHLDERAAGDGPFGCLVASGLHTIAVCVSLMSEAITQRAAIVAGRGMHGVQLRKPVQPGMRLTGTATVVERELRDNGTGIVACRGELRDDSDDLVLCLTGEFVLRRRPDAGRSLPG